MNQKEPTKPIFNLSNILISIVNLQNYFSTVGLSCVLKSWMFI